MDRKEQLSKILQSTEFKNFQITQVAKQDEQHVQNSNLQYNQAFLLQNMQLQQQMKQQIAMINNANAIKSYNNQPVPQFNKEINSSKELIPSYFNNISNNNHINNINNSYSIKDQSNKVAANLVNSFNKLNTQVNDSQQQQQGYINQSQRDLRSISREKEQNRKQPNSNSPKKENYQHMQKIDQKGFQKQQFQQPNEMLQNLQNYNEYCNAPQQQFSTQNFQNQNKQSYLLAEQIQKSKNFEQNSNLNASCNLKEEFNNIQSTDRDQKNTNGNIHQLNEQPQQNPQIKESFKVEIERRYQKSEINQIYRFPKDSNCSTDSESSLVSLINVETYNLNEQNTPKPLQQLNIHTIRSANQSQQQNNQSVQMQNQYLNNMQQSEMQTNSSNQQKQQFNQQQMQKQQNLQQISQQQQNTLQQQKSHQQFQQQQQQNQSQQRNMKVCLSQRNLNNQIKNNNYINTSTSFIAQNANNSNQNINLTSSNNISNVPQNHAIIQDFGFIKQQQHPPISASSNSQSKLKVQQNQQINKQTMQNNNNNNLNNSNTTSKTLKKNDQTKSFSDLRASNQNSNLNSNNFIQPQFQQNFQSSSLGRVSNTNNINVNNNNINPVLNQQNQISLQQSQQQLLQQPTIEQKSTQIQQFLQILQTQNSQSNLSKPNSANQFDNQNKSINQSQQVASNNYYLTERWKKDSNSQLQKNNFNNIQSCCNTLINNLTLSNKQQDSKLLDVQLESSQNNDQFLNVNQLLEKSGYQTFANVPGMPQVNINNSINAVTLIASNNVSTKNVNQSQFMSNNNFKQNSDQSFANNQKLNHDNKKGKVELLQDSIPQFNLTMNTQQEQTITSSSSKNQNYENRSRIQQDIELQNRIMKMRQNLDEKLRQSTSRSNEKRTIPQQQKTTSNDIIQKLKTIIQQNDMMGNPSSLSSRNTQRKDKYDTSKSFETKKANNTNNLYTNVNISVNNNSSQQIQNLKQFREQQSSLKNNNQNNSNNCTSSKQLDRNSSAKQLTNKSQSKEKLQSNSKPQHLLTQNSQNNLLQHSNNKITANLPHTPQSQANKQISALLSQKQGSNNSSSKLNQSSSNKQNNSLSKVKQQNITKTQQAVISNQTNNTSNISSSNFNNGTTTVATTTTTASNTNSTINPQNNIFSISNNTNTIQKTPSQQQGLTQQVQNAIAGLKMNQNILKDQQTQSIINQVIQKQQEQMQQNKMNSYKSSGSLLKNYSNSNLQVQTSRNQPKTNIRDVRIKLQEQPANNNCQTDIYTGNTNNVNNSQSNNNANNNNQRGKMKNFSFIFMKNIH
ncbi:hypothetical protein TTHERM_01248910 (macronuclear) [Tetrahymena thermophila SB210]|uniref:Uncharacterized protein n=1 Tax=Tetrahymena thermophila (strain SB210) TaxID=312017 RepID=Q22AB7_TETTS|nr:hypothetical protein TTHERM_01248910 [Tetrahymena thermophila SB210]EAR82232.1 hypothetical protein TTHERM_01248910 [Tetrahymena thermophila SB210]|eukprot:XP_001029895.1 hypothetical protein TTHERM_01248910 [Tetrahymena thermophila SB210]